MMLAPPPRGYDTNYIVKVNQAIQQEDLRNRKTGKDVELGQSEKLIMRSADGTRWQVFIGNDGSLSGGSPGGAPVGPGVAALLKASNLSDLANAGTARGNLGLGSAATLAAGTAANNAVQLDGSAKLPAVDGSALTGMPYSGAWTAYTPTVGATTGTLTSYTVNSARYKQVGKTVAIALDITITNAGTGAASITATLPAAANGRHCLAMVEAAITGFAGYGAINFLGANASLVTVAYYNNTFPGATGSRLLITGTYEAA